MPPTPTSINLLFIGNSFTARNDLPGKLVGLAAAEGVRIDHRLISVGGASLRMHWNKGEAPRVIRDVRFDFVVLQEQSTLPVMNAARMHENVRLFDGAIKEAGAKMALYQTWARKHAPEAQQVINEAYESIGKELGATVVPVGRVWEQFIGKHDRPVLHDRDGSHPTAAGTYLAACVFFKTLLGRSPVGVGTGLEGLDPGEVKLLQQAAATVLPKRARA